MNKESYLEEKYIKTKNKVRKITTYRDGENALRKRHEDIAALLEEKCMPSVFAKAYAKNSSIVKNARAHMYNDIFLFFDVKNFFPSLNHNYLAKQLYRELKKKGDVSLNSCHKLVRLCSVNKKGLPLGLVTSPVLSNIYMKEFDNILYGKLKKLGLENVIYTRYADDIVISYKSGEDSFEGAERIKELVYERLRKIGLKSNEKKEKVRSIRRGGHVRITGVTITRDDDNYRKLSVGRKKKDGLYRDAVQYVQGEETDRQKALKIKGYEAFVLAVEGRSYEECFSENMMQVVKEMGYASLHDLIKEIKTC